MALWLTQLGATVCGYALEPPGEPNLFTEARVCEHLDDQRADVRDLDRLRACMTAFRPELVFHMAAQSLVRRSYVAPVETYATNVMGTVNVLEAVRQTSSVRAVVCITTDKCYENREWHWGYREEDRLGGHDPYSNSKACAELVTAAYRNSFFAPETLPQHGVAVATVRAGNVIGGGDWALDRLIPDLLRAFLSGHPAMIRNPDAIRPWQHVLEPLRGYLMLGERLLAGESSFATAWNFGPTEEDARPVEWIVRRMAEQWAADSNSEGATPSWHIEGGAHPHEASYLKLDCSRTRALLRWQPVLGLPEALSQIVEWFQQWRAGADMQQGTRNQIAAYQNLVASRGPLE
jgi:CDP-glucose 4,6-dehydratase